MCFYVQQTADAIKLQKRYNAKFEQGEDFIPGVYNGFAFPKLPIISSRKPNEIQLYQWGLIPHWAKDKDIQKYTLNARIETLDDKPSFKDSIKNRCIVLVDGFFEWQWIDTKGRIKQKYLIQTADLQPFSLAGLYSIWVDPLTQVSYNTFTILTTQANELMSKIHNSKKRMPIILDSNDEHNWLYDINYIPLPIDSKRLLAQPIDHN